MYLYEQCRRLLQSSPEMLIEAKMPGDDQARHVDVLCFSKSEIPKDVMPANQHADESDIRSAIPPASLEPDSQNQEDDASTNSAEEENILNDDGDLEDSEGDHVDTDSAARPAGSSGIEMDTDGAAQPADASPTDGAVQPGECNDDAEQSGEDAEGFEESLDITALEATTSAHDDWLHRGPFLFDMDFHTYMRFTVRKPLPKDSKVSEVNSGGFRCTSISSLGAGVYFNWGLWEELGCGSEDSKIWCLESATSNHIESGV